MKAEIKIRKFEVNAIHFWPSKRRRGNSIVSNIANWNILVAMRKDIKRDFVSSRERTRNKHRILKMRLRHIKYIEKKVGILCHRRWKLCIINVNIQQKVNESWSGVPPSKLKYFKWPIANKYRKGMVKSTRQREWNKLEI